MSEVAATGRAWFDVNHLANPPVPAEKLMLALLRPLGRVPGYWESSKESRDD
ncbi:MAG: hypothetical protein M5U01_11550 [Ardenticatenaceae bacterium]|nr:hypothetical protein [Ardenticatenaceae bacterium]